MDNPGRDVEAGEPQNGANNAQNLPQPRQRPSVPSFLILSFILFMLTSHNGDEFLARHQHQDALQSLQWQYSNYTAWMNGTESNFTVPDRDSTLVPLLDAFGVQGPQLDPYESSYYSNITGFVHGSAHFYNISPPALAPNDSLPWKPIAEKFTEGINMTSLLESTADWNWTSTRKVSLSIVEKKPLGPDGKVLPTSQLALVHGHIELTDVVSSKVLSLELEGVHFLSNGSIVGFAQSSDRPIDIRLLPSLVPESGRNETIHTIGPELDARVTKLKNIIDAGIVDQDSNQDEDVHTACPFAFFAQIHPVPAPEFLMQELEEEIQNPTGITTISPPPLSITGVLVSKECGLLYEINETEGLRTRTFFSKVTTYAGFAALAYFGVLVLFTRQVEQSRTPAGISRVSKWTFLAQATMDSVSFAGHITFAILAAGRPSLSLIAPAFLACMLFVQEAQFFALVNQIQGPEDYTPPPPTTAPQSTTPTGPAAPVTAPNPEPSPQSMSFFRFFIHHVRTDPQARLWVSLFLFLTLIVRVILSPFLSTIFVAATYSSIWLPQIIRSARRGRSSGLSKSYVIGVTFLRLYSALYFLMCPKNVLDVEVRSWAPLLAVFVILQAGMVILQDTIGPSFFLPDRFKAAKVYDYHPPMPLPDPESPEQSLGDCAICMDAILVDPSLRQRRQKSFDGLNEKPSVSSTGTSNSRSSTSGTRTGGLFNAMQVGVGGSTARKNYSLAPCHHLFHTECLEKWLAIKNICPHCRRPLPPL